MSKSRHCNHRAKQKICEASCKDLTSLPQSFLCDFENNFGTENMQKYIESFNQSSVKGMRLNTLKGDVLCLDSFYNSYQSIPYFPNAFYVDSEQKLGNSLLHQCGAIYIQEPSSMIPVASVKGLDFSGKYVLDLCASPGGKTSQIATLMQNSGVLISNEIDHQRAKVLFSNVERLGIKNCIVLNESPQNLSTNFPNTFDYIFVDAPCSGEGMFRKDLEAICQWNENLKFYNQQRQFDILSRANKMLKQNGILIYSTCTFNIVENEQVVDWFCKNFDYEILPVSKDVEQTTIGGINLEGNLHLTKTRHFFPFTSVGEGQFVAVLKKHSENTSIAQTSKHTQQKLTQQEQHLLQDFFGKNLNTEFNLKHFEFYKKENRIYILPKISTQLNLTNLKVVTWGVLVGEIVKNRLDIHHQFFSAYGSFFKSFVNLNYNSDFLKKYVKGEELDAEKLLASNDVISFNLCPNTMGVIMVSGFSLGGVKIVETKLKNHYPKAFRTNKSF